MPPDSKEGQLRICLLDGLETYNPDGDDLYPTHTIHDHSVEEVECCSPAVVETIDHQWFPAYDIQGAQDNHLFQLLSALISLYWLQS